MNSILKTLDNNLRIVKEKQDELSPRNCLLRNEAQDFIEHEFKEKGYNFSEVEMVDIRIPEESHDTIRFYLQPIGYECADGFSEICPVTLSRNDSESGKLEFYDPKEEIERIIQLLTDPEYWKKVNWIL